MTRYQEIFSYMFTCCFTHFLNFFGILQQIKRFFSALFTALNQVTGRAIDYLKRNPPTFPPITGFPFHKSSATASPNPSRVDF